MTKMHKKKKKKKITSINIHFEYRKSDSIVIRLN